MIIHGVVSAKVSFLVNVIYLVRVWKSLLIVNRRNFGEVRIPDAVAVLTIH